MEVSALTELQQSLTSTVLRWNNEVNLREKASLLQNLLEQCRKLISSSSENCDSEICVGIHRNLLRIAQVTIQPICKIPWAEIDQVYYRQQGQVLIKLLILVMNHPSDDINLHRYVLFCGVLGCWRLFFATSETNMSSSSEAFKRSSLVLDDLLHLSVELFCRLQCDENAVHLCMILLEILSHSDVPKHRSMVLDALIHITSEAMVARVYPGLVSRIIATLPNLRESDYLRAMRVLGAWISSALCCDCTGSLCWRRKDASMVVNADKTSEGICLIFSRYGRVYPQYNVELCIACMRCGCLSQKAFSCLQNQIVFMLGDESLWDHVRRIMVVAPGRVKAGLRCSTLGFLRSDPRPIEALNVYLGYADLEAHITDIEPLDEYVVIDMLYELAALPPAETILPVGRLSRVSLCDSFVNFGDFKEPEEEVFCRVAAAHIARMPSSQQLQCISDVVEHLIVGVSDVVTVLRLLSLLRGFFSSGCVGLREIASEVVDVVMSRVLKNGCMTKEQHIAILSLLCVIFSRYMVEVSRHQICDILYWSLPWCMSDSERASNYSRSLLHHLGVHHQSFANPVVNRDVPSTDLTDSVDSSVVESLLRFYKNLLISSCLRELKWMNSVSTTTSYNVADVLFVLLHYKVPVVKDLFDLIVQLERSWPSPDLVLESCKPMDSSTSLVERELPIIHCYAFIADYLYKQFEAIELNPAALEVRRGMSGARSQLPTEESFDRQSLPIESVSNLPKYLSKGLKCENAPTETPPEMNVEFDNAVLEVSPSDIDFKDRRLSVSTIIATRCRYHIGHEHSDMRYVALFALSRCFSAFSHNVPLLRIRLYECWDPLMDCLERNLRNLRIMTSILGIMSIGVVSAFNFVERWLLDVFVKLSDLVVIESTESSVTIADEVHRSIRYKFTMMLLDFVMEASRRVVNQELLSRLLLIALFMCKSTAPSVERVTVDVIRALHAKNPEFVVDVLMHTGSDSGDSVSRFGLALNRDVRRLLPQGARIRSLLPLDQLSNVIPR